MQRVFDLHDGTSFHDHSETCHKGKPDVRCRLCYERALRPETTVVQLAPDNEGGYVPTDDIAEPHPSTMFSRNRREYPLANVDARALVWEMARPQTPFPDIERDSAAAYTSGTVDPVELLRRIDAIEGEKSDLIKSHLRRIVCERNAAAVDISPTATALLACNTAAVLLGCSESCKSTLFYLLKYITKDSTALGHSLTVLREAVAVRDAHLSAVNTKRNQKEQETVEQLTLVDDAIKQQAEYPSVAEDTGTDSRSGKQLLAIMVNKLSGMSEYADTQVASCNLGYHAHTSSDTFTYVFVRDAVVAMQSRLPADHPSLDGDALPTDPLPVSARRPSPVPSDTDSVVSDEEGSDVGAPDEENYTPSPSAAPAVSPAVSPAAPHVSDAPLHDASGDHAAWEAENDAEDDAEFEDLVYGEGVYDAPAAPEKALAASVGSRYRITDPVTFEEEIVVVTQEEHYRWRGVRLTDLCFYQYPSMIEVVKRGKRTPLEEDPQVIADAAAIAELDAAAMADLDAEVEEDTSDVIDENGGADPYPDMLDANEEDGDGDDADENDDGLADTPKAKRRNLYTRYDFHPDHPLYRTHYQKVRGKFYCPILCGGPPPPYPVTQRNRRDGENVDTMKRRYAAYMMTLFSPWTMDVDGCFSPRDGVTWDDFCRFMARLDGVDIDTGFPIATTFEKRIMFETIENISRAMAPPLPDLKRWSIQYRARATTNWNQQAAEGKRTGASDGLVTPCTFDAFLRRAFNIKPRGRPADDANDKKSNRDHQRAVDAVAMMQAMTTPKDADAVRDQKLAEEAAIVHAYCDRSCSALDAAFTAPTSSTQGSPWLAHAVPAFSPVFTEPLPNATCKRVLDNLKSDANTVVPSTVDVLCSGFTANPMQKPRKQYGEIYVHSLPLGDPAKNVKGVTPDQKEALLKFARYCDAFYNHCNGGYENRLL